MSLDGDEILVRALRDHNPWWETGIDAFSVPPRAKSDFYHLTRPDEPDSQFEDQPILGLVGRRGVGKTTLLEQFVHHRIGSGDRPDRFLYIPFDADPLYQLQSDTQLRRAIQYYERRILGDIDATKPHFILLDDVHQIDHPNKPTIDGWGVPVSELYDDAPGRHVVVTASAGIQIDRALDPTPIPDGAYATQPILPEKFRDYVFSLYPELEDGNDRVTPTPLRTGRGSLVETLETGDLALLVETVEREYQKVADVDRAVRAQVVDYLAMGGIISYAADGVVESAAELSPAAYARLREDVRDALYQEVPGFESIQTLADLERLCALAARNRGTEPVRYQELVERFDVDRRTITNSYLPALESLYLLTGATEYDNSRPRAVRLYLRDTGLTTALVDGDGHRARTDFEREAELARIAGYDHTMRFAYGINAEHGTEETPRVSYWRGDRGEVDYVFEVDGTPVPVGLAYRTSERESTTAAVQAFTERYDVPVGLLVVGETVRGRDPIEHLDEGLIKVPYWLYLLLC